MKLTHYPVSNIAFFGYPPGNGWSMGPKKREGKGNSSTQVHAGWDRGYVIVPWRVSNVKFSGGK